MCLSTKERGLGDAERGLSINLKERGSGQRKRAGFGARHYKSGV
jgi:hypothetical protein